MNTYDCKVDLGKKKNFIYFMIIEWFFIWKTWFPFIQGCFVPSLVEICPVVMEKKNKMWKVYDSDGQRTNFK